MPDVNEESITTVPLLPEAENISANDLLYLVQGLGADRDKKLPLWKLLEYVFGSGFSLVQKDSTYTYRLQFDQDGFYYTKSLNNGAVVLSRQLYLTEGGFSKIDDLSVRNLTVRTTKSVSSPNTTYDLYLDSSVIDNNVTDDDIGKIVIVENNTGSQIKVYTGETQTMKNYTQLDTGSVCMFMLKEYTKSQGQLTNSKWVALIQPNAINGAESK